MKSSEGGLYNEAGGMARASSVAEVKCKAADLEIGVPGNGKGKGKG